MGWYPFAAQALTQFSAECRALKSYLWLRFCAADVERVTVSIANKDTTYTDQTPFISRLRMSLSKELAWQGRGDRDKLLQLSDLQAALASNFRAYEAMTCSLGKLCGDGCIED